MTDPLAPLRERFRQRAVCDLSLLQSLAEGDLDSDALKTLAHNIAGAAGTFGYVALGEAALAIDTRFSAGLTPEPAQVALLAQRLRAVAER